MELEVYVSKLTEIALVVNDTKAKKTIVDQKIDRKLKPLEEKLKAILNKTDALGKIAKEKLAEYEDTSVSSTESRKSEQILSDLFSKSKLLILFSADISPQTYKLFLFVFLSTIQMFTFFSFRN